MVFDGFFLFSCGEMSPWCGQEGDLPHQLMLARCGQSVIVCPLTVWFSLLPWSATVDFFLVCILSFSCTSESFVVLSSRVTSPQVFTVFSLVFFLPLPLLRTRCLLMSPNSWPMMGAGSWRALFGCAAPLPPGQLLVLWWIWCSHI